MERREHQVWQALIATIAVLTVIVTAASDRLTDGQPDAGLAPPLSGAVVEPIGPATPSTPDAAAVATGSSAADVVDEPGPARITHPAPTDLARPAAFSGPVETTASAAGVPASPAATPASDVLPDGRVAWSRWNDDTEAWQGWMAERPGEPGAPIAGLESAWEVAFSPDGTRLAFSDRDGVGVRFDDGRIVRLDTGYGRSGWARDSLAWSPDGRWVAWYLPSTCTGLPACSPVGGGGVWVADADGEEPPIRVSTTGAWPSWSPDGEWVAVSHPTGVTAVRRDGSDERTLYSRLSGGVERAWWSPTSSTVAVSVIERAPNPGSRGKLETIDVDTGNSVGVLPNVWAWNLAWSPGGERLAFVDHMELVVADARFKAVRRFDQEWWEVSSWSPDGDWLMGTDRSRSVVGLEVDGDRSFSLGSGQSGTWTR